MIDPDHSWKRIYECLSFPDNPDSDRIHYYLQHLKDWLDTGGHPPFITGNEKVDKAICEALIHWR